MPLTLQDAKEIGEKYLDKWPQAGKSSSWRERLMSKLHTNQEHAKELKNSPNVNVNVAAKRLHGNGPLIPLSTPKLQTAWVLCVVLSKLPKTQGWLATQIISSIQTNTGCSTQQYVVTGGSAAIIIAHPSSYVASQLWSKIKAAETNLPSNSSIVATTAPQR